MYIKISDIKTFTNLGACHNKLQIISKVIPKNKIVTIIPKNKIVTN